jgi:hypothetical protein
MTDAYNTHTNGNLTSGVDSRGSDPLEKDFSNGHNGKSSVQPMLLHKQKLTFLQRVPP